MKTLERFFLNSHNTDAGSYYKIGKGFPIVLLHGFAETYEIWENVIPVLAEKYQLILPYIPGCGTRENFKDEFSMERIAQYVNSILEKDPDVRPDDRVVLCGHSMGGYAAMAFAEEYPEKLLGLSLVHSSAAADNEEKKQVRQKAIEHITQNGKVDFLKTLIPKLYGSNSDFSEEKKEHLKMANQYSEEQIIACYTAMKNRSDRQHVLKKLNCPVQFIGGKEDQSISYKDLESQSQLCQSSYLHIFEEVGHTSMNENPKILLEAIIGFVDDILQTNGL